MLRGPVEVTVVKRLEFVTRGHTRTRPHTHTHRHICKGPRVCTCSMMSGARVQEVKRILRDFTYLGVFDGGRYLTEGVLVGTFIQDKCI